MASLTPQTTSSAGVVPTANAAAGGGDTFANDGNTRVRITNGGGAPITATFTQIETIDGVSTAGKAVSITNGTSKVIGPFRIDQYGTTVSVAYSSAASVTIEVLKG